MSNDDAALEALRKSTIEVLKNRIDREREKGQSVEVVRKIVDEILCRVALRHISIGGSFFVLMREFNIVIEAVEEKLSEVQG